MQAGQYLVRGDNGDEGLWKEIGAEVHNDADRLFKMIGEAYAVLSDPTKVSLHPFTTMHSFLMSQIFTCYAFFYHVLISFQVFFQKTQIELSSSCQKRVVGSLLAQVCNLKLSCKNFPLLLCSKENPKQPSQMIGSFAQIFRYFWFFYWLILKHLTMSSYNDGH